MLKKIWIDNLIKVLEYENKLYGQLLAIAGEKAEVVINGEIEKLQELTGKERRLSGELDRLSDAREQIMNQIERGLGKKQLIFSELVKLLPKEQAKKLSVTSDKLQKTIGRLSEKNNLNRKLLQNALEYVEFSFNLLSQPVPQTTQYGRKGDETGSNGKGILDIKY